MMLSVIIPTCNRNDLLAKCLQNLDPSIQSVDQTTFEIIVTDDSPTGNAKVMIEKNYPFAQWIEGPKKGPAANRNNGVKHAKGDWIIFLDDDCLPDEKILDVYTKAQRKSKDVQVFEGCIKVDRKQQSLIEESPINETGGYLWSCNFMISKKLFMERLNGFDEMFPYASMEDVDLHYRLKKMNINCLFLPNAIVIHPWRLQKKLISITQKRFQSTLYFLSKHPERRNDINSAYYLKAFYHYLFGHTLRKSFSYKFKGFFPKVANDLLHLYFAAYLFFNRK
jgi:GT2 family glycosyltransferase